MLPKTYKIAFVSEFDSDDISQRSGVPYFIANGFRELGHEVIQISHFGNKRKLAHRIWNGILVTFFNKLFKGKFGYINNQWSAEFLRNYAFQAKEKLSGLEYDFVFSPESHTIAYLEVDKPIVFWRDATFENLLDYYEAYSNIHPISVNQGHQSEIQAIKKSTLAVYTSKWAADSAKKHYNASAEQIVIIERGANFKYIPSAESVSAWIIQKLSIPVLKILFIGADWKRKGGDIAFELALQLNNNGIATELHAIGGIPKNELPNFGWFKHYGFIKKDTEEGAALLQEMYTTCHFFVMPSLAENFGIVYAEASAFGMPSLGFDTGGVPAAISEGKNGFLFPMTTTIPIIANKLQNCWVQKSEYKLLAENSRKEFETRLNWKTNCKKLLDTLNEKMNG
jgi:glycosyltransferase involved in cell wall biosynthesis